ncbi:type I restriction endonuclease subunit R [Saprospira grandis]|uniref:type I restriction endonuclease subunit R n=1 Tax=Saprospira grandis TaxID=1008 RepID=UPI0022DE3E99|nr:HsdR family type I site-specific deoxyribonuclease [Saprospira grandis]WBM75339.1 HsdR family type I site-specific deoxyribonuclease [Saprospira grandis]
MPFTELNTIEHYIIQQLTGVNLNKKELKEQAPVYGAQWQYKSGQELGRNMQEILVESELKKALIRLNPSIAAAPERAEEVLHKMRAVLIAVNRTGLVRANEQFASWLLGEKTFAFGKKGMHVPIHLIDFENLENNSYIITNQYHVRARETKIPDVVLLVNGIPLVVGEAKTPIRPAVSWLDGAHEIHAIYENAIPQLFVPNVFSFATEGKELYYGSVRSPLNFWAPWRLQEKDNNNTLVRALGLQEVGDELKSLLSPKVLLDMLQNFAIYTTDKKKRRIKIVARFQQYEGANMIVDRVKEGRIKKGLIWHFQGSGKSFLMLFAAQKLRKVAELRSPTVIVLVDRVDLDTQITGTFNAADVSNMVGVNSIAELQNLLERDTRKILISTIFKFKDAKANLNTRDNIIVLVDEAHRTQEGDLGRMMRAALPNAFLFGLTGTPINKADKNTFWAFGAEEDSSGYMTRYTFQDSIRDKATLPLHFEPRLVNVHIDKDKIDELYAQLTEEMQLDDLSADALGRKVVKMTEFQKAPKRMAAIAKDIAAHFKEKVAPHGFKAMLVAPDRFASVQYKELLDQYFPTDASIVVISTNANDDFEFKQKWGMEKDAQEKALEKFNDPKSPVKFVIVTGKLLTGFDAPILQTMYLDKPLKAHTLLQAICRTNRLYDGKTFGRIVDYFGVFDDAAKALEFDERSVQTIVSNLQELRDQVDAAMLSCLSHFAGVDRTLEGFEGLEAAQEAIKDDASKDAFAGDYVFLSKLWESLSPDPVLNKHKQDYRWLTEVYQSVKPSSDNIGKLLWHSLGAKTLELIHSSIEVDGVSDDLSEFVLDADVIEDIFNNPNPKDIKKLELDLIKRFKKHKGNASFKALSERLEKLRDKAEAGLIKSIDFIKELCKLAQETVQAEKEALSQAEQKDAKTALTELFLEAKTAQTPAVVTRLVNDIDSIVKVVRFDGWQTSASGEREVQKSLRKTLLKYKLHKEHELFERAYEYIKEYY